MAESKHPSLQPSKVPPDRISARRERGFARRLLPFLGSITVLFLQGWPGPSFFDDAYITFRYARNLADGIGLVYNAGQPVLGTTTPLFSMLLGFAGVVAGRAAIPHAAYLISICFDALSAWLIFRLAQSAFSHPFVAALISMAFALHPFRLSVAAGGMETSLYTLLLLLSFHQLVVVRSLATGPVAAVLALLTRPDAALPLLLVFVYLFCRDRAFSLRAFGLALVLYLPWLVWATFTYGSPLPNSIAAKSQAYASLPGFAAFFILTFLGTGTLGPFAATPLWLTGCLLGLAGLSAGLARVARLRPEFLPIAAYPLFFFLIMAVANAPMFFPWYFAPVIPGMLFCLVGLIWFLPRLSEKVRLIALSLALLVALAIPAYLLRELPTWPLSRDRERAYQEACRFVSPRIQPGDVVLAPDIGVIGWCLPEAILLDPVGLVSPEAIPYFVSRAEGPAISLRLVQEKKPQYIIALEQYVDPFLKSSPQFSGWYRLDWSRTVMLSGIPQTLYVYVLTDSG